MFAALLIAAGGAIGALSRFGSNQLALKWAGLSFPYGTLLVNTLGSLLAGFFMIVVMDRFAQSDHWRLFFMIGFLGGFTTFSSYAWETFVLFQDGEMVKALFNILTNNVCALLAVFLGAHLGRWLGGVY